MLVGRIYALSIRRVSDPDGEKCNSAAEGRIWRPLKVSCSGLRRRVVRKVLRDFEERKVHLIEYS